MLKLPVLLPPHAKSWLTGKDTDAGKEEKGTTENEVFDWHHQLNGHEFEQTLGDSEGQRSLVCCSPWGHKQLDTTEQQQIYLAPPGLSCGMWVLVP